jgi:tRNA 2-selenouridine synthase
MAVEKISIGHFVEIVNKYPVLDVRSPGEYNHAHIPGAHSLPLFTDEERKVTGTTYKQKSREAAIKVGVEFFGPKMKPMIEEAEKIIKSYELRVKNKENDKEGKINNRHVIVHCWRGGMRSAGVAWLLDLYGFKVYTLVGGYKAFRNWVLQQFVMPYKFKILGGYTGSGKTVLIKELRDKGETVIDLEGLAHHKGSAFGALGEKPQPSQEMFENLLACELYHKSSRPIWLEDEAQRIGKLSIPNALWPVMRSSPVYFLDIPFEERLDHLVKGYGAFEKERLADSIMRIQKKLGGLETKNALALLDESNITECFRILLKYYDKLYGKSLQNREGLEGLLKTVSCETVEAGNVSMLNGLLS